MPIDAADSANTAFGIWPFGVHGGGHAEDGHPGWDVEFRPGAMLRAAADGTVQALFSDSGRFTLQIQHGPRYRTDYTGLASVAPDVTVGAEIRRGQVVGVPGTLTATIGRRTVTYAITHFQVDDFTHNDGQTNPFAVNPESVLSAAGRSVFEQIWSTSAYAAELVEPFPGNPRNVVFPLTRVWTREGGALAPRVEFTRASPFAEEYEYVMRDSGGAVMERGTARIEPLARPEPTIDFRSSSGTVRLGLWDVVGDRMRLSYGVPGAERPAQLPDASVYRTQ